MTGIRERESAAEDPLTPGQVLSFMRAGGAPDRGLDVLVACLIARGEEGRSDLSLPQDEIASRASSHVPRYTSNETEIWRACRRVGLKTWKTDVEDGFRVVVAPNQNPDAGYGANSQECPAFAHCLALVAAAADFSD